MLYKYNNNDNDNDSDKEELVVVVVEAAEDDSMLMSSSNVSALILIEESNEDNNFTISDVAFVPTQKLNWFTSDNNSDVYDNNSTDNIVGNYANNVNLLDNNTFSKTELRLGFNQIKDDNNVELSENVLVSTEE